MNEWPDGYALRWLETVDSTNSEAKRLAAAGESGPLWIAASHQTAGRGRRGRAWESPPGNLAATLLLKPDRPASDCAQLSFVAALAAFDAILAIAPHVSLKLKWPNDVLAEKRKIAGILLESSGHGAIPAWLAIGIGVNLAHHPDGVEFPATSLGSLGQTDVSPQDALTGLATSFAHWYDLWTQQGFAPVREAWLARAAGLGSGIRARLQTEEVAGVFKGIDDTGALVLDMPQGGQRIIAAGDVFFA